MVHHLKVYVLADKIGTRRLCDLVMDEIMAMCQSWAGTVAAISIVCSVPASVDLLSGQFLLEHLARDIRRWGWNVYVKSQDEDLEKKVDAIDGSWKTMAKLLATPNTI